MATPIIIGLLSFLFVTLTRMQGLRKEAEIANIEFVPKRYFEKEVFSIIASMIPIIIWLLVYPEFEQKYPPLKGWFLTSFAVMGALGSWIFQKFLGNTKKWISGIVDVKTNIADRKTDQP